jgi:hypothetical protein
MPSVTQQICSSLTVNTVYKLTFHCLFVRLVRSGRAVIEVSELWHKVLSMASINVIAGLQWTSSGGNSIRHTDQTSQSYISTNVLSVWIAWFILRWNSDYQWILVNPILTSFLKQLKKRNITHRLQTENFLITWRMASSGMLRRVALVRTNVSEELRASVRFFVVCVGC